LAGRNKRKGEGRPIGRLFREKAEGQPLSFPQYIQYYLNLWKNQERKLVLLSKELFF